MIGVRTAVVERRAIGDALELVGFVAPDESRLRRVQLRVSGWVQRLHVSRTGQSVRAGEPLLALYSPELYQSEQEFLIETGLRDSLAGSMSGAGDMNHEAAAAPSAVERLRLLGVPDGEIERLRRERRASTSVTLTAPAAGTVLERGVSQGQYVGADTPLFTIADLSRLWVLADLYEMELPRVHAGETARFTADGLPGRSYAGRIDFVYPTVSSETRTAKARLVLDNPGGLLRPGMFGKVRTGGRGTPSLVVPNEAVVDAGEHRYVFLAHAGGHFEPRRVVVGLESGDDVQILSGLAAGDTVVASASFLIDSESRLKAAIAGMGSQPTSGHSH
jgi:multidrug efflux pump subunit AcrA (membrane-fusion protein)